ncbi:MAG: phosphate acyltransferase PlsX [Anaerolineales bacterium]|nr:phosphate acyltransferase PlsX [Anaerolineales bacterium]
MVRIVIDAMGSDEHPAPDVEGAVAAARAYGVEIILVGDEALIRPTLEKQNAQGLNIRIVHAPDMLTMEDKGEALLLKARAKDAKNSMAVGIDLVKSGEADAFVTAGNTGAGMATAIFRLGRIRGVDRPALAPIFPTAKGSCVVLDIGANPNCKPENLLQFGILGSVYAEKVRGVKNPKVGLISNGEEEGKGNELIQNTTPLFKASSLNYVGNVEGKEVIGGAVDVAVVDGFTGNVMLKTSEAVAKLIVDTIRSTIKNGNLQTKIGGMLVKPALSAVKKMINPSEQGAATMLGVNGLVFIAHGRSDALAIQNSIRVAKEAVEVNVLEAMKNAIEESVKK